MIEKCVDRLQKNREGKYSFPLKSDEPTAKEVFDLAKALEVVDGDMELFREIADLFLVNLPDHIAQIQDGIARGDAKVVERAAHSLKGSVSNFGAKRAFETAYRLEVMGKEGRLAEAEKALSELERDLKELEAAMQGVLS